MCTFSAVSYSLQDKRMTQQVFYKNNVRLTGHTLHSKITFFMKEKKIA
jgi:hypothetical protein